MFGITNLSDKKAYEILLASIICVFCFIPNLISISVLVLLLFTIYQVVKKNMTFHFSMIHLAFVLFFAVYAFGVIYTNHPKEATGNLERRMLYVLFPLLFSFQFPQKISFKFLTLGLILGIVISSILGLIHSYSNYQLHGDFNNSFGSTTFSYIHHPTYFSAMILISLFFFKEGVKRNWKYFNRITFPVYFLFAAIMQFFCFSFAGMLFFFFVILFWGLQFVYHQAPKWVFGLSLFALPLTPILLYYSNIHIQIEMAEASKSIGNFVKNPNELLSPTLEPPSGNKVRMIMWVTSLNEIAAHPFGSGTSNFDDVLGNRLRKHGLNEIAEMNYNPHNQFLSIAVELGIIGLLVFLFLLYQSFKVAFRQPNKLLLFILLILTFNMLFESMLQRQSGIVFYTFFICILPLVDYRNTENVNSPNLL